jgi:hypothetical protein
MSNGIQGSLYYNQLATQGEYPWMYNRYADQVMMNPDYNQQAISDYNWDRYPLTNQDIGREWNIPPSGVPNAWSPFRSTFYDNWTPITDAKGNVLQTQKVQQPVAPPQMTGQGLPYNAPTVPSNMYGVVPSSLPGQGSYKPQGGGWGTAAAIAQAAPTVATDIIEAFRAPKVDTEVTAGDWSGYNPQMGLGDDVKKLHAIKTGGMIGRSVGRNTLKFAGTGASIGTSIMPGIGTAIGAAAGALAGAITGFFGGRRKKKKVEEQKTKMRTDIQQKMQQFGDVNLKAQKEYQAKRIALQQ